MLMFGYVGGGGAKGSCLRNHSLEKMLNNMHIFFSKQEEITIIFFLLYGIFNRVLFEFYCTVVC